MPGIHPGLVAIPNLDHLNPDGMIDDFIKDTIREVIMSDAFVKKLAREITKCEPKRTKMVSRGEAARIYGVHPATISRWVKSGKLKEDNNRIII